MRFIRYMVILIVMCFNIEFLFGFKVENIPIQDEGRIKPFDTFARNHLLAFYGKRSLKKMNLTATDWLINLILNPDAGRDQKIFNIRNPEVASSLFLDWDSQHKYSFNQIVPGLREQSELLVTINQKESKDRTVFEKHLLEISNNILRFEELTYLKALKLINPMY